MAAGLCLLFAFAGVARAQDEVELLDGTKLEGRVVFEDERELILIGANSKERTIALDKVKSARTRTRSLHAALDHWDRLKEGDAVGLWELAAFCRDRGLSGEAQVFAWMVLRAEPEHAAAHALLDHKLKGNAWYGQSGKIWMPLDRLHEVHKDFKDGWEFTSLHYRLQSNLPLERVLTMLIDLERFHRFFYGTLGAELKLREVMEPMYAAVYADEKSFPKTADNRKGYYTAMTNTLFVLADQGLEPGLVYHEASHQLLICTATRESRGRGSIPAWVNEGIAVYFEHSGKGLGGHATFEAGKPVRDMFAAHATEKKPFDLSRMFSFASADFMISSKATLKYAQSYSLVHFCLHGEGGKYRPGFLDYLRRAYMGDASSTSFRDAMKVREQDFEKAWHAYARAQ